MKWLFDAIRVRYSQWPELVRTGRKTVRAVSQSPPGYPRPCVLVAIELVERLDDFAHDAMRFGVRFQLLGKKLAPADADTWLLHMERAFHRITPHGLVCDRFLTAGSRFMTATAPIINNEVWDGACGVDLYMERISGMPAIV